MRPSTRTSELGSPRRFASAILAFALSCCALGAWAAPVLVDATAPAGPDLAAARGEALASALGRAVEAAVERHVPAPQLQSRAADLRAGVYARPGEWVRRYAIVAEVAEPGAVRVTVEADVDRDRLLQELRAKGFSVLRLAVAPRVLVVAEGSGPAAGTFQAALGTQGLAGRLVPADAGEKTEVRTLADWARGMGCHFVAVISPEGAPSPTMGPFEPGAPVEGATRVRARVIDVRRGTVLGSFEAEGRAWAADPLEARARALSQAGRLVAGPVLAAVEQSGWAVGPEASRRTLRVEELRDPRAVEQVEEGILALAETRSAALRSLSAGAAEWVVEVLDSGLPWPAVVEAVRLPRGRLVWLGGEPQDGRAGWRDP